MRPEPDWRRLDAKMLLVHPVNQLVQFLPAVLGVLIIGEVRDDDEGMPAVLRLLILALPVLLGVLQWFTTSYRITDEQLQVKKGLLERKTLTARLDRVRSVDVTAPPLHRILGLAKVQIGTGADQAVPLDGLGAAQAQALRAQLLHRAALQPTVTGVGVGIGGPPDARPHAAVGVASEAVDPEEALAWFRPGWVRYAPFTLSGLVTALAVLGFVGQYAGRLLERFGVSRGGFAERLSAWFGSTNWWLTGAGLIGGIVVGITVLSVASYVLANWGYVLTRRRGAAQGEETLRRGSLQIRRGLVTTRSVSLDDSRIRGARITQTLLLRLVAGASASVLLTGSGSTAATTNALVPAAPANEVGRIVAAVLEVEGPTGVALLQHGPAARRRVYTRALLGAALILGVAAALVLWRDWPTGLLLPAALPLLAALPLAWDRYRSLGYALVDGYLVVRWGSVVRRREMLVTTGVLGWAMSSTWFQRRNDLVDLRAITAAGSGAVRVRDVPRERALELVRAGAQGAAGPLRSRRGTTSATATGRTG